MVDSTTIDPLDLAAAGWAVVVPKPMSASVREALAPLLELRRSQAGSRYRELEYKTGESVGQFLVRYERGVNSDRVPYYLLLVGGPDAIPFEFQQDLVEHAVGRVAFDTPEECAAYARS